MRKVSEEKRRAIVAAADALLAEGNEAPTNDDIRTKLGGGSIADISPVMRQWREERKEQTNIRLSMPQGVAEAGQRFVAQLWASADVEASKAVKAVQDEARSRISAVEAERDEALTEIPRLEEEAGRLRQEIDARERQIEAQDTKIGAFNEAVRQLEIEREKALARADAAQEAQAQIIGQLKEAQANNKALQDELVALARAAGDKPKS